MNAQKISIDLTGERFWSILSPRDSFVSWNPNQTSGNFLTVYLFHPTFSLGTEEARSFGFGGDLQSEPNPKSSAELIVRSWAKLTFSGVINWEVRIAPYHPTLSGTLGFNKDIESQLIRQAWDSGIQISGEEYGIASCLLHPLGDLSLMLVATGQVLLHFDPKEVGIKKTHEPSMTVFDCNGLDPTASHLIASSSEVQVN